MDAACKLEERGRAEEKRVQVMKGRLQEEGKMLEMLRRDIQLGRGPRPKDKDEDEGGRARQAGEVRISSMFEVC